jgi:VWFA-related protein
VKVSSKHWQRAACVVLAGFAWNGARAQPKAVIRAETRLVLVDAIVTGKNGAYIRDLTTKDFRIWEDNREQAIQSVSLEAASSGSEPHALILFFDETSMDGRDQIAVRQAASRFIDAEAGRTRRMAVVTYNGSLRVAQTFTDNAGRLKDALVKPQSNVGEGERSQGRPTAGPANSAAGELGARNMINSLVNLADGLTVIPGRKIVVLFAGRIPSSAGQKAETRQAVEACNKSDVALYPVDVQPIAVQTDSKNEPGVRNRNPYGIPSSSRGRGGAQPHGDEDEPAPGQDPGAASQEILFALAGGTGGFVVRNSDDLLGGLQSIAAEQNAYYVLSYAPPESKLGSCHVLRVKVDRSGAKVRARTGYCTAQAADLVTGTSETKDFLEKRAAGTQPGNISASIELPYFYIAPNRARVHVVMEIAPVALKFENKNGKLPREMSVLGIAASADGEVRARFNDTIKLDAGPETPVSYEKEFEIGPGQYTFTLVFGEDETNFGKAQAPLVVEAWTGEELALSSLVLSKQIRPAGESGLGLLMGNRKPLIAENTEVVPSGSYLFPKSQPAFLYFELYGRDPSLVKLRVRILDSRTGEAKWDSGVTRLSGQNNAGTPGTPGATRLPLDSLPAGSYRIEMTATNPAGKQARRTADFEVR